MKNKLPLKLINWYQREISPNKPPKCRFIPTCSEYAKECYQKFNFVYASFLTTKRLIKCNPLHKIAYDPVPLSRKEKKELQNIDEENKD